jgi:hypothetical protein
MTTRFAVALSGVLLAGSAAFAQQPPQGEPDHAKREQEHQEHLQAMKQEMLKDLDAQISTLQKFRSCVSSANDQAAMKACNEQRVADMKAIYEAKKKQRLAKIEEQQKKLEQEKQQLQQQKPDVK